MSTLLTQELPMSGTPSQIEWAVQIKPRAGAEFDRVAAALKAVSDRQPEPARAETLQLIGILGEKRAEVMARTEAGYFIQQWQELSGRVQGLLIADPRYLALRLVQKSRRAAPVEGIS
ncbi:MAG: hypothetical protein NTZ56_22540 [Acidobacteria bacterium]|nr:hypothetical protein [Acidobacteriota bacterium]